MAFDTIDWNNIPPRTRRGSAPIALDMTPAVIRGEPLHEVCWLGRQWAVTSDGIECLDGSYMIEADRLFSPMNNDHTWPMQMAGKRWANVDELATCSVMTPMLHGHGRKDSAAIIRRVFARLPEPRAAST